MAQTFTGGIEGVNLKKIPEKARTFKIQGNDLTSCADLEVLGSPDKEISTCEFDATEKIASYTINKEYWDTYLASFYSELAPN